MKTLKAISMVICLAALLAASPVQPDGGEVITIMCKNTTETLYFDSCINFQQEGEIKFYDNTGDLVLLATVTDTDTEVDAKQLPAGSYTVSFSNTRCNVTQAFEIP